MAYYVFYFIGLFGGNKRIMAEGLMVVQVVYVGIVGVPILTPLHSAITALTTANNPYNLYYS